MPDHDKTPQTAEAPHFAKIGLRAIRPEVSAPYEFFAGRDVGEVHNVAGCALKADVVLVKTYAPDPYVLAIRLGEAWYELAKVAPDDPALADLPVVEHGPSPEQLAQQRRKDEVETERLAAEAEYRRERQRLAEERRRKAEEHQARVVEENRRRMGV